MEKLTKAVRQYMQALGAKGGTARKHALTPERRSEIAKQAVTAREAKRKSNA